MNQLYQISEANLSIAWAKAFLQVLNSPQKEISSLLVTITGFDNNQLVENVQIRQEIDTKLIEFGKSSCETVAGTIFPKSLWNPGLNRQALFDRYANIWWRVKQCHPNKNGTYFQRLTAFRGKDDQLVNQLDHIINIYVTEKTRNRSARRSALQASIFDPGLDHNNQPYQGFPCLQHVIFSPEQDETLSVTGIYVIQHMFEKAYGNYLGLCRLGEFMAKEMGLQLTQVNCLSNIAKLGNKKEGALNKSDALDLKEHLTQILASEHQS